MAYDISTIFNNNFTITQFFGQNLADYKQFGMIGHNGVDFVPWSSESWNIQSVSDGVVIETGNDFGGFGNFIKIKTENQIWLYAHLSEIKANRNDLVKKSQIIGKMGNTGNSEGAHLHLGLKITDDFGNVLDKNNGYFGAIDPLPFLLENKANPINLDKVDLVIVPQNVNNPKPPTPETWAKLEKETDDDHFKLVKDAVQNLDFDWLIFSYADRFKERKDFEIINIDLNYNFENLTDKNLYNLETIGKKELEITILGNENYNLKTQILNLTMPKKEDFDFTTPIKNPSQNLENMSSKEIFKDEKNYSEIENVQVVIENPKNSSTKPFWESKKFLVVVTFAPVLYSFIQFLPPQYRDIAILLYSALALVYQFIQGSLDATQLKNETIKLIAKIPKN